MRVIFLCCIVSLFIIGCQKKDSTQLKDNVNISVKKKEVDSISITNKPVEKSITETPKKTVQNNMSDSSIDSCSDTAQLNTQNNAPTHTPIGFGQGTESGFGSGFGKPIIYLYPTKSIDISIVLDTAIDLVFTYPKYKSTGWNITAEPNGDLTDIKTGHKYYSLFWEGYPKSPIDISSGFIVKSDEIVPFLEKKLAILGLNFRESQEFIVYWAPILKQNNYSLINFSTDKYAQDVPLNITPKPDTEIRIMMYFKIPVLGEEIIRQVLSPVERSGFTVVEWGGMNLDADILSFH